MRSSGYGLKVVKTTNCAADAEQIARSSAPLGAFQTSKPFRHAAVSGQNHRRRAPRPPGEARRVSCKHKRQPTTRKTAKTRSKEAATSCAQVVAAATATGSQSICGGLWAHLARSLCHTTPSRCLCPENPSPGHTKRQITMIAGASRGEWLRGPMHFGFGVLGTHKKSAGRLSPDEVAPSSRKVNPHIFARDRTPRTARGLTPP